jgi:hypothetical protein
MQPQAQSQMALQQQPSAQVQQITPQTSMAPQQIQAPNGAKQAPSMPNLPTPPPRVRGNIPRNPGQVPVPQATPAQPQGQQPVVSDE